MAKHKLFVVAIVISALIVSSVNAEAKRRKTTGTNTKLKQTQADAPLPDDYEYYDNNENSGPIGECASIIYS